MGIPLKALIVEDNEGDLQLLVRALTQGGYEVSYRRVEDTESLSKALLGESWDVVFLDYRLPNLSAPQALQVLADLQIDKPCIVVSGAVGEEAAVEVMRAGAHDFIPKNNLSRLIPVVQRELSDGVERGLHARTRADLRGSEDQFKRVFNLGHLGMAIVGLNGAFLRVNQAFCALVGCSESELGFKSFDDLTRPDDPPGNVEGARQVPAGPRGSHRSEKRFHHRDGGEIWAEVHVTPVLDAKGSPLFRVGVLRDITERRRQEGMFRDGEERFRSLSEAAQEGILFHRDGLVLDANQALLRLSGFSLEELRGMRPVDLLAHESRPEWESRLLQPEAPPFEARLKRRTGPDLPVEISTRSLPFRNLPAGMASFYDLTARKDSEKRVQGLMGGLQDENRDLQQSGRLQGDFLAVLSHDLRTPLTSIIGYLKLLRGMDGTGLSAAQLEFVETALKNSDRLSALVNNLSDLSQLRSQGPDLAPVRVSLDLVASAAVRSVQAIAQAKQIPIRRTIHPQGLLVWTEPDKLERILSNLLSNAVKFTPPGGFIELTAGPIRDGGRPGVLITVKDTGVGIAPEAAGKVFDQFFQTDNTKTRSLGGTGLGLAVCKGLVEAHLGRIWVESLLGAGTSFRLFLPDQT